MGPAWQVLSASAPLHCATRLYVVSISLDFFFLIASAEWVKVRVRVRVNT